MVPAGNCASYIPFVVRSVDIIDKSGLHCQLTPMGTILHGEWDQVMAVVTACYQALSVDCERIGANFKIDTCAATGERLKAKVSAVERTLERKLSI